MMHLMKGIFAVMAGAGRPTAKVTAEVARMLAVLTGEPMTGSTSRLRSGCATQSTSATRTSYMRSNTASPQ